MAKRIFFIGLLITLLSFSQAHWADLAAAEIVLEGTQARLTLTVPTGLLVQADTDKDDLLSAEEVETNLAWIEAVFNNAIRIEDARGQVASLSAIRVLENTPTNLDITPGTHSTLLLIYMWDEVPGELEFTYDLFLPGVSTASLIVTVLRGEGLESFVLTPENRRLSVITNSRSTGQQIGSFLVLGVKHILTGYDHLLFLLTLLMVGGSLRYLLKIVTAFTIAHSVTLSLAVLDIVTLPPRWVESGIALSIAYVAAENLWRSRDRVMRSRWLLTFAFGLIHGLGFAGILKEIELPASSLAISLISFNFGVELGQIAVVALAFAALTLLRRFSWESGLRRWVSASAVVLGLFWFVERAFVVF